MPHENARQNAADALDGNFDDIFEIYERRLVDEQNLLAAGGEHARGPLREHARSLVMRAAGALRGASSGGMSALEEEIRQNAEAAHTPLIQHPDESFRAGVALCAAALAVILDEVDLSQEPPEAVVGLSLGIQKSIMDHVARVSMAAYVDYLLVKIEEIQTEERTRFSRDLHDHIAHSVALVKQNLELHSAMRPKDEAAAEAKLRNALEASGQALRMARDMALELRSSNNGDSLRTALDNLIRASAPPGTEVEVEVSGEEARAPSHVRDQIYMTMREGLRNAVSHSGGAKIRMEISISEAEVVAAVEDWGDGFDASSPSSEGIGLRSMRERAKLMRGTFDIASTPGNGTRTEIRVPLNNGKGS